MAEITLEQQQINRKIWTDALRSGQYEQGARYLELNGRFCCLGVLSKLAGSKRREMGPNNAIAYDDSFSVASEKAMDWVGLSTPLGGFVDLANPVAHKSLSQMNDNGTRFDSVADFIDSEPFGLFRKNR